MSFKEAKKVKTWHSYRNVIFYLGPTDTLSLYLRIAELSLLGYYFSFGSNWVFSQVKKDYKKLGLFGIIKFERSYRSYQRSESFLASKIERSKLRFWQSCVHTVTPCCSQEPEKESQKNWSRKNRNNVRNIKKKVVSLQLLL